MAEPLPCPFCGGPPLVEDFARPEVWHVSCINLGCAVKPHVPAPTEAEAVATWNRRAPTPDP